ncbi:hypothetical [Yersinia pestis KIM10+]|uniref:Uncharacterized protein n=1 Tax=Yersinia pestis TaxID=632 RepID=Q8CLQ2_YERPE|nr:hypothetical [Yersinia pestis KIM10+]
MTAEINGYIGKTQGVNAIPIPISSAHKGEKGNVDGTGVASPSGCVVAGGLTVADELTAAVPEAVEAATTTSSGITRVSGG